MDDLYWVEGCFHLKRSKKNQDSGTITKVTKNQMIGEIVARDLRICTVSGLYFCF